MPSRWKHASWPTLEKFGADEQKWSVTALLHDFDYEMHPDAPDHPMKGEQILKDRGVDEEIRRAILSHPQIPAVSLGRAFLEEHAFACDELAGFLSAVWYVSPRKAFRKSM